VANLFNHLSGYTRHRDYQDLLVAPDTLRPGLLALIDRERQHAMKGRPAHITMKFNAVVDEEVIDALYLAAQAGVEVDLVVRGMCALRPGIPGVSEGIRVRSILGRFLEHSRLMRFANGGDEEVWLGSADAMHRNLDRRVEAMARVTDEAARERLSGLLDLGTSDAIACWVLDDTATWVRRTTDADGNPLLDYQELLVAGHGKLSDLDALTAQGSPVHLA
jgi:polyphosphate kinase